MKLPTGDKAVVDIRKLRDYCLSATHPRGRHKAKVFAAKLGLTDAEAEELRQILLDAAKNESSTFQEADLFGQRYMAKCEVSGPSGPAEVRSLWIVRHGENFPRLLTCYVL